MARPADQIRRQELALAAADYLAHHGVGETSLRTLATALGTTSRMLVHYFGTKERLFTAALNSRRPDFATVFDSVTDASEMAETLRSLWQDMTRGDKAVGSRLLMQVLGAACAGVDTDYEGYARHAIDELTGHLLDCLLRMGCAPDDAKAHAHHIGATFRGLLLVALTAPSASCTDETALRILDEIAAPAGLAGQSHLRSRDGGLD